MILGGQQKPKIPHRKAMKKLKKNAIRFVLLSGVLIIAPYIAEPMQRIIPWIKSWFTGETVTGNSISMDKLFTIVVHVPRPEFL